MAAKRLYLAIVSWPFLIALAVLLLNDLLLKAKYPGLITGKLSDFAGLVVVALPMFACLKVKRIWTYAALTLLFSLWKSSASDPIIRFIRMAGYGDFGRTVDYTDLVALAVLPLCYALARSIGDYSIRWHRLVLWPTCSMAILALLGTSVVQTHQQYLIRSVSNDKVMTREKVVELIESVASSRGMKCVRCTEPEHSATYSSGHVTMTYTFVGEGAVSFHVRAMPTGMTFFGNSGYENADMVRQSLKNEFSKRFPDLEYLEALSSSIGH